MLLQLMLLHLMPLQLMLLQPMLLQLVLLQLALLQLVLLHSKGCKTPHCELLGARGDAWFHLAGTAAEPQQLPLCGCSKTGHYNDTSLVALTVLLLQLLLLLRLPLPLLCSVSAPALLRC